MRVFGGLESILSHSVSKAQAQHIQILFNIYNAFTPITMINLYYRSSF